MFYVNFHVPSVVCQKALFTERAQDKVQDFAVLGFIVCKAFVGNPVQGVRYLVLAFLRICLHFFANLHRTSWNTSRNVVPATKSWNCFPDTNSGVGTEDCVREFHIVHIPYNRHVILYLIQSNCSYNNRYALYNWIVYSPTYFGFI